MIDVVIPASRSASDVHRTLEALGRARIGTPIPADAVVVVDDRPDRADGAELAASVASAGARLIPTQGRAGPGAARNIGAAVGSSPWILFCDDDVEVDDTVLSAACALADRVPADPPTLVIGGLRPPRTAPIWLRATYADGSQFSASAALAEGPVPLQHFCAALALVPRPAFESAGGYPPIPTWEDAVLGLRVGRLDPAAQVRRDHGLAGIHWNVPDDWGHWLDRQRSAGARLAALAEEIDPLEHRQILASTNVTSGWRAQVKRTLARLPSAGLRLAQGRRLRRAAASAAFARGYLDASSSRAWSSS